MYPNCRRWLSRDPSGEGSGINLNSYVHNDPGNRIDPLGLWTGVDDAIAIGGGAIAGIVGQFVSNSISGKSGGYLGGAVSGETFLYTANPILAGAAGGFTSSLVNQTSGGGCPGSGISGTQLLQDTVVGAAAGAIPIRIPGDSLRKQILTKLGNGTIENVSDTTLAKIAGNQALSGVIPGAADAVANPADGGAGAGGNSGGAGCPCSK